MGLESVLVLLVVGAVAGWLAGQIVSGGGLGLVGNIVVGILGALIASLVLPRIGLGLGGGMVSAIIHSTIGAVILLVVLRLVRRG
ncbi:GlsB/YeaQ/YmgE family stress response membrane protein [Phaeovulum sp.]|uniref:GlsB/YeaQ/YmgE family stress response membrane protein n=1 Tax=Phaeovulum sp. TaxID=2934796 RepID=UPI00356149D7